MLSIDPVKCSAACSMLQKNLENLSLLPEAVPDLKFCTFTSHPTVGAILEDELHLCLEDINSETGPMPNLINNYFNWSHTQVTSMRDAALFRNA